MDIAELRKLKDEGARAMAAKRWSRAVELFEKVVAVDGRDLSSQMRLAEALARDGQKQPALAIYQRLAETYANQGFLPKAIALCKVILELDPTHNSTQKVLAGLYARKSGDPGRPLIQVTTPVAPPPSPSPTTQTGSFTAPPQFTQTGSFAVPPQFTQGAAAVPPPPPSGPTAIPPPPPPMASTNQTGSHQLPPRPPPAATAEAAPPPRPRATFEVAMSPIEVAVELSPALARRLKGQQAPKPDRSNTSPARPLVPAEPAFDTRPPAPAPRPMPPPRPVSSPGAEVVLDGSEVEVVEEAQSAAAGSMDEAVLDAAEAGLVEEAIEEVVEDAAGLEMVESSEAAPRADWAGATDTSLASQIAAAVGLPEPESGSGAQPVVLALPAHPEGLSEVEAAFAVPVADSVEESIDASGLSNTGAMNRTSRRDLPRIALFSDLTPEAFVSLMEQCGYVRAEPGQVIVAEGDPGNSFFVVCSGNVRVVKGNPPTELALIGEGSFFGEMALLNGSKRAASVVAADEAELLEISAVHLNQLVVTYPQVAESLRQFARQRLLSNVMATSALFRPFEKDERKRLVELFKVREVLPGERVVEQGTPTDGLYLVMTGELEVVKHFDDGAIRAVAALRDGEIFGEMSMLSKKAASADVVARRRSTVLRLPRERFEELIVSYPQVLMMVSDLAESRTRSAAPKPQDVLPSDSVRPPV